MTVKLGSSGRVEEGRGKRDQDVEWLFPPMNAKT